VKFRSVLYVHWGLAECDGGLAQDSGVSFAVNFAFSGLYRYVIAQAIGVFEYPTTTAQTCRLVQTVPASVVRHVRFFF
jgi:hypothetical protein